MSSLKTSQCLNPDCLDRNPYDFPVCQSCGSSLLLANRYRAIRRIGSGGFARTFEAVDELRLGAPCLIKQFCPPQQQGSTYEKSLKLFEQEAVILKNLGQNPQIPTLLAFFEDEGRRYIIQEYIEGRDLFKEVNQSGAWSEERVRQVLAELLPILDFIHERQVIHRDIKPSNIIRRLDGSLVLIDFGGSEQLGNDRDRQSPIAGTPGYAAPEQMRGFVSPASDLYSLGVTCIRLLSGCFPGDDGSDPLFDAQQKQWRWREAGIVVSAELERTIAKLLQPETRDRFQSAIEVLQALNSDATQLEIPLIVASPASLETSEIDYSQLETLLAAGKYKEADAETWNLMLQIARRDRDGCLNINSLEQFPIADLKTLDRLWQHYSDGRFGFSAQKQIYQSLGGNRDFNYEVWKTFGERVGWHSGGDWLNYENLTFDLLAPTGHLPVCVVDVLNRAGVARGVCGWWRLGFVSLVQRLDEYSGQIEPDFAFVGEIQEIPENIRFSIKGTLF
jgi:serine/threonine protein kinase